MQGILKCKVLDNMLTQFKVKLFYATLNQFVIPPHFLQLYHISSHILPVCKLA